MADFEGAIIEIVERSSPAMRIGNRVLPAVDASKHEVIVPNEIRINGHKLATSSDHPVKVHAMEFPERLDCVLVTLTLICKRVSFYGEGPQDGEVDTNA